MSTTKFLVIVLAAAVAIGFAVGALGGGNDDFNLEYVCTSAMFFRDTLYVEGYIRNASSDEYITGIKQGSVDLYDDYGYLMVSANIPASVRNQSIPAGGRINFNFNIPSGKSYFTSVHDINYGVSGEYNYTDY